MTEFKFIQIFLAMAKISRTLKSLKGPYNRNLRGHTELYKAIQKQIRLCGPYNMKIDKKNGHTGLTQDSQDNTRQSMIKLDRHDHTGSP